MEGIIIVLLIIALPIIAAPFVAIYFIGKALINYAAKKNAEAFHYDELARKIAGEIIPQAIRQSKSLILSSISVCLNYQANALSFLHICRRNHA